MPVHGLGFCMSIEIRMQLWLETECYHLLADHVPRDSPAYLALQKATKVYNHGLMPDVFCMFCSNQDTTEFIFTAMRNFPDCVGEIVLAIINAKQ
jgi:hypothetical protein